MSWTVFFFLHYIESDTHKSNRCQQTGGAYLLRANIYAMDLMAFACACWTHYESMLPTNNIIYYFRSIAQIVTVFMFNFTAKHMPLSGTSDTKIVTRRPSLTHHINVSVVHFYCDLMCWSRDRSANNYSIVDLLKMSDIPLIVFLLSPSLRQ